MIRPQRIAPPRIMPPRIMPQKIPPVIVPPPPPSFAPTPYLLDFLTPAWNTENGAIWAASSLGNFIAANHVEYDAQTPNNAAWSAALSNAEPSVDGDMKLTAYAAPFASAPNQVQMQCVRLSAPFGMGAFGYVAMLASTGGAPPTVRLLIVENDVPSVFDSQLSPANLADIGGLWLKVKQLTPTMTEHYIYVKESGVWVMRVGGASTTGASAVPTKPTWLFTSNNGAPVADPQIYHAVKYEGNRDASIVP